MLKTINDLIYEMNQAGLIVDSSTIATNGKINRTQVEGKPKFKKDGWYAVFIHDEWIAAVYQNYCTQDKWLNWRNWGDDNTFRNYKSALILRMRNAIQDEQKIQQENLLALRETFKTFIPFTSTHQYLIDKNIQHITSLQTRYKPLINGNNELIFPVISLYENHSELINGYQTIFPDGTKWFKLGTKKKSSGYPIIAKNRRIRDCSLVCIGEGVASMYSTYDVLSIKYNIDDICCIAAFDAESNVYGFCAGHAHSKPS